MAPNRKRYEIEQMFEEVLGYSTCPHGVYLPENHCAPCGNQATEEGIATIDRFLADLKEG